LTTEIADLNWRNYEDFDGDLNATWRFQQRVLNGENWLYREPSATCVSTDGVLEMAVDKFERFHDTVQGFDSAKHLMVTNSVEMLPPRGLFAVRADIAATKLGGSAGDFLDGVVSLHAFDPENGVVFDLFTTGQKAAALYEVLPNDAPGAFSYLVEAPIHAPLIESNTWHQYCIVIDAGNRETRFFVDGTLIYRVRPDLMPKRIRIGIGLLTIHQQRNGRSTSCRGQGMKGRWRRIDVATATTSIA
jgi:hypothetical protein